MQIPPDWAAYAATVPVLENRRQSLAFMAGVGLKPQALRAPTNHIDKSPRKLEDWSYVDTFQNWGCPLVGDWLDIDVDARPKGDHEDPKSYTPAFYAAAIPIVRRVHDAFTASGLRFRSFGRHSLGNSGHFIVECPVAKADEELLRRLHMRRYVEVDGIMVRIEVRRRSDKKETAKNWTLPGSVYRRHDGAGYDLIEWSVLNKYFAVDGAVMPRLDPQPYEKLRLAMYTALMGLALLPYWERGNRHECALHLGGALAHEWREGTLSEDECVAIMQFMIDQTGDSEGRSRQEDLKNSLTAIEQGRKVTGYTRLAERFIGDEWKKAILALRGGGDPDAVGRLFEIVARVHKGLLKANTYVDLSAGAAHYVEMDAAGLRHRFRHNIKYPPVINRKGKLIEAIEIVMASPYIRTFDAAVAFPGIPFGVVYTRDDGGSYNEVEGEHLPVDETLYLNVAAGFVTKPYAEGEAPAPADLATAIRLWRRLRAHLTSDAEEAAQLDQVIAHKLQKPREKHPVGLAMVGGQKIGKSFLWEVVMKRLLGDTLVRTSSNADLKSEKRLNGIDRCLFYICEETRFDKLLPETQQLVKDVMRNPTIHVDTKWGGIGPVTNRCVPVFLSNEPDPQLIFDGVPDRALVVVHGDSQEDLELSNIGWKEQQDLIHKENQEFLAALSRPEFRRALLHYFLEEVVWNVDLITSNNESRGDKINLERGLSDGVQALIDILREGYLLPLRRASERGPSITDPFALETLGMAVRERLKDRRLSYAQRYTDNRSVGRLVAELFRFGERERGVRKSKGIAIEKRERRALHNTQYRDTRIYWFRWRRGELLAKLEEQSGIKIEPDYTLAPDREMGEAPIPEPEALAKAFDFATKQAERMFGSSFGII